MDNKYEVREIKLNRDNVMDYQEEDVHSYRGQQHLELHMDLNTALSEATSSHIDAGGRYASWLNNIGIEHQTDAGWWNETAVCPENMQLFADYYNDLIDDDLVEVYPKVKDKLSDLPKGFHINNLTHYVDVEQYLRDQLNY